MIHLSAFPDAMPISGLIGGLMIGLASAIFLLGSGRIAGISGLFARATGLSGGETPWKIAAIFVISLLFGAMIVQYLTGPIISKYPAYPLLIAGGLFVGFGTRLGSGCTSGHGVCGMSRFSTRSLVATPIFIGSGMATVVLMNILGWNS